MPRKKKPYATFKTTIEVDERVWRVLELDSDRSRRPVNKQLEMILAHYYGVSDGNIDAEAIERIRRELQLKAFTATGVQLEE